MPSVHVYVSVCPSVGLSVYVVYYLLYFIFNYSFVCIHSVCSLSRLSLPPFALFCRYCKYDIYCIAQSYLEDLVPSVFNTLDVHGYFFDPVDRGQSVYVIVFFLHCQVPLFID